VNEKILLVASARDPASMNIFENLRDLVDLEKLEERILGVETFYCGEIDNYLIIIGEDLIMADFLDNLPRIFNRLLFLSKHASESKMPSLLVHFPGNWTLDNSMGGEPRKLSIADPILHRALIDSLIKQKESGVIPENFTVGIEVTHHGPTLGRACTFIEIGSTIDEWKNQRVGRIVAECVIDSIRSIDKYSSESFDTWIGFGGPHYAPKFFSLLLKERIMLGHLAPKYVADEIDDRMVREAFEFSLIRPKGALIDWKGLRSPQRKKIVSILENLGMSYSKI